MSRSRAWLIVVLWMGVSPPLGAQAPSQSGPPQMLTLDQAIQYADDHYPAIKAALEQVNASTAEVDIARAAYLPRLDSVWQSNRATANNIFGQLLPQSVIPSLTGPVLPGTSGQSVWGSATGALFSWEAVDFGLRRADVASARASLTEARAGEALTRLDVQNAVAQAYLTLLASKQALTAAQADLDRRNVLLQRVQALVTNQLRAGADASRAQAEQAAAHIRVSQAQQAHAVAQAALGRVLGRSAAVTIADDALLTRLPPGEPVAGAASAHPLAQLRQAAVAQARAEQDVVARTDRPRILVQSSVFARGSGASADGPFDGGIAGLGLDRANWAAGIQVQFPNVFDFSTLRARKAAAAASERASAAQYDEALLTITSEQQTAAALLQASRAIADDTPVELSAARESETQARARYDAGLASIVDVADAQSLLAQAEVQDRLARIDVWRALLAAAVASGDLTPFVNAVRHP